jgi:hypothetical protein
VRELPHQTSPTRLQELDHFGLGRLMEKDLSEIDDLVGVSIEDDLSGEIDLLDGENLQWVRWRHCEGYSKVVYQSKLHNYAARRAESRRFSSQTQDEERTEDLICVSGT